MDFFGRDVWDEVFEGASEDLVQLFSPMVESTGVGVREAAVRVDDVDHVVDPVKGSVG